MKAIYPDEWSTCKSIATEGTKHKVVKYFGGKYAKSNVHKNVLKGGWRGAPGFVTPPAVRRWGGPHQASSFGIPR